MAADPLRGRDAERQDRSFVVCVVGPTAAGKTDVAVELVARFPCEIVSVDSAMVYRHMDIGTAKPRSDVLAVAPHHLIDIRDPWESYSAGEFCVDARALIDAIHDRGRIPLLVGGTFLYFHALQFGLARLPTADAALRAEIDERAEREGWPALHRELAALDPQSAERIRPNDRQRLQRALEVVMLTGEPLSELQKRGGDAPDCEFLRVALAPSDRTALHARIEARLDAMVEAGFIDEVERLMAMPQMNDSCPAMRAVGYRQVWSHLAGEMTLDEALRQAVVATRRLAKRQLTWMRSGPEALEFDCLRVGVADHLTAAIAPRIGAVRA
ncbi:MAG: tRNA (adenosine(37)-N6)-dimethylallyltransferase MiaA [Gammaproteobacteria bacterium]|nr:tRNA (adenosine(37)-N6)-dimethylallyltransferase MiaA [Gammaproteobacteria bacterium]